MRTKLISVAAIKSRVASVPGRIAITIALLIVFTIAVYGQTRQFSFVSVDDGLYVYNNTHVKNGLTREGIYWSIGFGTKNHTYWHPLSWMSHMLDVELFGLRPAGHHLMSVCLHLANALLLFAALARLSGAFVLSGIVAVLFAVHPLNVESIAWVAERKNVLSTNFLMLSILTYTAYVKKSTFCRYGLLALFFLLGLMAKPMLMTLPGTLLLLDYWPIRRVKAMSEGRDSVSAATKSTAEFISRRWRDLIIEKIPLMLLSLFVALITMESLRFGNEEISYEALPMAYRLQNAVVAYVTYILKILWPTDLAFFYPYPMSLPAWKVGGSTLLLVAVSFGVIRMRKKRPYLVLGWFWFLGNLVPVSGVVQAGMWPAWADRWAYVPSIGLFVIMVWGANDLSRYLSLNAKRVAAILALLGIATLACASHHQAGVWKDDIALYENAVKTVEGNFFALSNLGEAFYNRNDFKEAERLYSQSLTIAPFFVPAHIGMGNTLLKMGSIEKAYYHYSTALRLAPNQKNAINNIGIIYLQTGRYPEAIKAFEQALLIDAGYAEAHNNIGFAFIRGGRHQEAARHIELALALDPENQMARANMIELLRFRSLNDTSVK